MSVLELQSEYTYYKSNIPFIPSLRVLHMYSILIHSVHRILVVFSLISLEREIFQIKLSLVCNVLFSVLGLIGLGLRIDVELELRQCCHSLYLVMSPCFSFSVGVFQQMVCVMLNLRQFTGLCNETLANV